MRVSRFLPTLTATLAAVLALSLPGAAAVKLVVAAHQQHCVEQLLEEKHFVSKTKKGKDDTLIEGGLLVTSGKGKANLNARRSVDVKVYEPSGTIVWQRKSVWMEASISAKAMGAGTYTLCMTNNGPSRLDVTVEITYFTLSHLRDTVSDVITTPTRKDAQQKEMEVAQHVHLTQLHDGISELKRVLASLEGDTKYMERRLERHMQTAQSTYDRSMSWTLFEMGALACVLLVQTLAIRLYFTNRFNSRHVRVRSVDHLFD